MIKRLLPVGAAFAASVASAWPAVPPSVQRDWHEGVRWSVRGAAFADGKKECVLANIQPRSGGITSFVLSDVNDDHSMIMFDDTTITWDAAGGSLTLQVDGNPSFTGQSETDTKRNLLIVPLANTPGPVMTALLDQLASGHELHVGTIALVL